MVLGDRQVVDQGPWKDLKIQAASVTKFSSHGSEKNAGRISESFNRLNTQLQIKEEAEVDLSRQSGDTALYGKFSTSHTWHF